VSSGKRSDFLKDWPTFFRYIVAGKTPSLAVLLLMSVASLI